ncbi:MULTISPECIES: Na+/H+ antiporter subunit E [Hyphomicrobiales]|uniref:Multicomponent Na+:H+ antiporter subunit E n=3 Tax=Hyphomicrobiales TaxID=356 RepID=A0A1G5MEV6_AFIMA|nr:MULTISPECIES: Na+/H+ antiporter subunit E [Hyphomicrobiales]MBK1625235.1 Na+/H+ antiporter subunit E [Afifella marina DSM 2698]MBK1628952.1 Na+/H+ antiporter subunit E [Afifella marina]MBK5918331.1 Na+/H+ antiporter subunit E [Afifella marina]MCF1505617.1 Na+/H+ antiporter subunit E [Afifella sp. H1R]MCT8266806.1 Na+/H+ antiporter subunit E [Afifella sp. JA880]
MVLFPVNVLLALAWASITGSFTLPNLLFGFVLGAIALWLIREQIGTRGYIGRSLRVINLFFLFIYELVMSALKVTWIVLQPKMPISPGLIAYPLRVNRDFEITLLANLITLTPGTLSVDVSEDRRTLYIHAIDVPDPDQLKRDIAQGFERKILEAFR